MQQFRHIVWFLLGGLVLMGTWEWMVSGSWAYGRKQAVAPADVGSSNTPGSTAVLSDRLIPSQNAFGFKLFSEVMKNHEGESVMISPVSVAIALSMTYNGANGETRDAIGRTLELQDISLEELNQANAALTSALEQADPSIQIGLANSLWASEDIAFKPDFIQRNRDYYRAAVEVLNFSLPGALERINGWVSEQTRGLIPQMLDEVTPDNVPILINTIYFKGNWTQSFNPEETQQRSFQRTDGSTVEIPFMTQSGEFLYLETEEFQGIQVPYGSGRLNMVVLLPGKNSNLEDLQRSLTPENWQYWMGEFQPLSGTLQLPRFESEFGAELNDVLAALGMEIAFEQGRANFSNMAAGSFFIREVKHKTYIKVDEEGTEAAAATSISMGRGGPHPFVMVCDRPFFYAIYDQVTGSLLFLGAMQDPSVTGDMDS